MHKTKEPALNRAAFTKAVEEAIEKGGYDRGRWTTNERVLLDPQFFQALGKARGWGDGMDCCTECGAWLHGWQYHWHRFIDHLAEGKDAESFFASLEPANSNARNVPNSPTKTI